ncbi:uncharacterized protein LOC106636216 [Copidosoma floridanum]|uniref:uncharacterized protein LOC106636216 n=1 Tax=Copidosoma floridanum TaxID=29053 RepID=UPI000C6F4B6B|nr:uncharacterized protein LOC106636216 [Copidosoma floridanum]
MSEEPRGVIPAPRRESSDFSIERILSKDTTPSSSSSTSATAVKRSFPSLSPACTSVVDQDLLTQHPSGSFGVRNKLDWLRNFCDLQSSRARLQADKSKTDANINRIPYTANIIDLSPSFLLLTVIIKIIESSIFCHNNCRKFLKLKVIYFCRGSSTGNVTRHKKINLEDFNGEELSWLRCTRYCPPKLPRKSSAGKNLKRKPGSHPRIPFTKYQLEVLEDKYKSNAYLARKDVVYLSDLLHLPQSRIKIWFQNRRARARRESQSSDQTHAIKL